MGAGDQPYMYQPSQSGHTVYPFSTFNPRAVSQAAYKAAEDKYRPRPKQEGPLITFDQRPPESELNVGANAIKYKTKVKDGPLVNFNQHPDSYMLVNAGQNSNHKPMPASTKMQVTVVRWIQFALRIFEEIGALGLLVCVICLKNIETSVSWIMRVPPAWDGVITLYAIYHLVRPAKARTPASSASYHMFALFMDVGLTPFYAFTAVFSHNNYVEAPGTKSRWASLFPAKGATTEVLLVTFLGAAVLAGLHVLSAILDLWLIVLFRMINNLPPDMNPLEDNLTGRSSRTSKHKYKNSESTFTESVSEKKPGYLSGSTLSVDDRSRLSTANKDATESRTIAFRHSRTGSEATFSPHNPETARWSRQQFEEVNVYRQSPSARASKVDVDARSQAGSMSPSKATFVEYADVPSPPPRSTDRLNSMRPTSYPTSRSGTGLGDPARLSSPALPNPAPSNALVKSQQKQGLLNDNWYSVDDGASDSSSPPRDSSKTVPALNIERHDSFQPQHHNFFQPQPLKMNPPTPPPPPSKQIEYPDPEDEEPYRLQQKRSPLSKRQDNGNGELNRYLTVKSTATDTSSVYSESAPPLKMSGANGTPKRKYYGDLATATRGVRGIKSDDTMKSNATLYTSTMDSTGLAALGGYGFAPPPPPPQGDLATTTRGVRGIKSDDTMKSNATLYISTMDSTGMAALGGYGFAPASPPPQHRKPVPMKAGNRNERVGRVVSRTGVDIVDAQTLSVEGGGFEMRDRRDVSGKVAEEGRGGGGWLQGKKQRYYSGGGFAVAL